MNIAILVWYNDQIKSYADNFYIINKKYTDKHGYDIIKSSIKTYRDRNPHWERYPMILRHIKSYDYVIWIDADAHFYIDAPPITDLINKYNKEIIFSADQPYQDPRTNPCINSGVMILKNTQKVIDIVERLAYSEELKDASLQYYNIPVWEDQNLIRWFVKNNLYNITEICVIVPYLEIQHFYDKDLDIRMKDIPYIRHMAGTYPEERVRWSKNYIENFFS